MLLNALHFYMVMTIHLFIVLTSGIHCVIAARSRESTATGKHPRPSHSLSLLLPLTSTHILLFLPCLLCVSLLGQRTSVWKSAKELVNEILAEGTIN